MRDGDQGFIGNVCFDAEDGFRARSNVASGSELIVTEEELVNINNWPRNLGNVVVKITFPTRVDPRMVRAPLGADQTTRPAVRLALPHNRQLHDPTPTPVHVLYQFP